MTANTEAPGLEALADDLGGAPEARQALRDWLSTHAMTVAADTVLSGGGAEGAQEGDRFFWMLSGWAVAEKRLPDARHQGLDVLLPADVHLEDPPPHADQAPTILRTLTESLVSCHTRDELSEVEQRIPGVRRLAERRRSEREQRLAERLLRVGQTDGAERLTWTLLDFAARLRPLGLVSARGEFRMPLNQTTLGELNGLSNVHVCRLLRQLDEARIVSVNDQQVTLDLNRASEAISAGDEAC